MSIDAGAAAEKAEKVEDNKPDTGEPKAEANPTTAADKATRKSRWSSRTKPPQTSVAETYEPVKIKRFDVLNGVSSELSNEVTISAETVGDYSRFLNSYVRNLGKLAEVPGPVAGQSMLDYIKSAKPGDKFGYDAMVLKMLGTEVRDFDSHKLLAVDVNADNIKKFLSTGDGWVAATQLMEQYSALTDLGLGMAETINSAYLKSQREFSPHLEGSGWNTRVKFRENKNRPDKSHKQVLHAYPTMPRGLNVARQKSWAFAKVAGFFTLAPGATTIQYDPETDLIAAAKASSAEEKAYLAVVMGIDVDKVDISTGTPKYQDGYAPDTATLLNRNTQLRSARENFLGEAGIDPRSVRGPEEFIFDDDEQTPGMTLRYHHEIMQEYGNPPLPAGADNATKLKRMIEARRTVLVRYLEHQIALEKINKGKDKITKLKEKAAYIREHKTELAEKRKKDATEAQNKATEGKKAVEDRRREFLGDVPELTTAVTTLQESLASKYDISPDSEFGDALRVKLGELRVELDGKNDEISDLEEKKSDALSAAMGPIDAMRAAETKARADLADAITSGASELKGGINITAQNFDEREKRAEAIVNGKFDRRIAKLQTQYDQLQATITALERDAQTYRDTVMARDTKVNTAIIRNTETLQNIATDFAEVTDPAGLALTEDQVRTLSPKEIADLIYSGPDVAEQQKALQKALNAKGEANARQTQKENPVSVYQENALTLVQTRTGLRIEQIAVQDQNELRNILVAAGTALPPEELAARIRSAKALARDRVQMRLEAQANAELGYYESIIKEQGEIIKKADNTDERAEHADLAAEIMGKQTDTYDRSNALEGTTDAAKFLDTTLIDPNDTTYTETERAKPNLERWYMEWFYHLNPEAKSSPQREKLFETFFRILSPDRLRPMVLVTGVTIQQRAKRAINDLHATAEAA